MLGSKLARRIVVPVLLLLGALFALLAFVAVRVADERVEEELDAAADRVAATLDGLRVPRERWPEILPVLANAVGAEIVVDGAASRPGLEDAAGYRVVERRPAVGPGRYRVLTEEARVLQRRADVLGPILWTGAVGLLVAVVLGFLVARTIARPVKDLADQTRRFAEGLPLGEVRKAPGEIGELQNAFRRMVVAIREGEEKLRESERFAALGRLAGGIAHELRNPLTAIRMAVETATPADSEARTIAVSEIERLERTLREMLDYVRPREPRRTNVPVAALFDEIVKLLKPQCDHLNVRLVAEDPGDRVVSADKDRLKQALLNLVLNAAQAQPRGGSVTLRAGERGLEVADEGPGIPEDVRENLLQPFVTTKEAGIGLGLAVVKQVADEHGAELSFETGPAGTTFRIGRLWPGS